MCEELANEYRKLRLLLDDEGHKYVKDSEIFNIRYNQPGPDFYKWKQTDNATYYRKYDDIYVATHVTSRGHPHRFAKLPVEKEIKVYGLYELFEKCNNKTMKQ
jgi:hypothetical protein